MSDPRRFDEYIPLFGKDQNKDIRARVFLHELHNMAEETRQKAHSNLAYQPSDLKFSNTELRNAFKNRFFTSGSADDKINDEWYVFFIDLLITISDRKFDEKNNKDMITAFQRLSNYNALSQNGTLKQLVGSLMKEILGEIKAKTVDVKNDPSKWNTVDELKFTDAVGIMNALFTTVGGGTVTNKANMQDLNTALVKVKAYQDAANAARTAVSAASAGSPNIPKGIGKTLATTALAMFEPTDSGLPRPDFKDKVPKISDIDVSDTKTVARLTEFMTEIEKLVTRTAFTLNEDLLALRELERWDMAKKAAPAAPKSVSSFFNVDTTVVSASGAEYFQDDKHQLWKGKPNQEGSTPVSFGSNAWKDLKISNKCVSTGFVGSTTNGNTCRDYLMSCLSGNKIDKCKQFLSEEAFFDNAEAEVKNMNPELLYSTLRAFQFNFSPSDNKVDSYEQWTATLNANPASFNLTSDEVKSIVNNGKLKAYLGMIVSKVNSNPDIVLSKRHLKASSAKPQKANPSVFGLQPRKINVNAGRMLLNAISTPYVLAPAPNPMAMLVPLSGGGLSASEFLRVRSEDASKRTASTYANIFADVENRLAKLNKSVDDETKQGFDNLTLSLDKYEQKLIENFNVYQKYLELHEVYGKNDKNSEVTMGAAKEFTERGDNITKKVAKKRMTLERILNALEYAAENQGNVQPASTSNPARQSLP
jgi:hypothetical protein